MLEQIPSPRLCLLRFFILEHFGDIFCSLEVKTWCERRELGSVKCLEGVLLTFHNVNELLILQKASWIVSL